MRHEQRQALIRRKFALETRLNDMTDAQVLAAPAGRLAASFGLSEIEAADILSREKSRRRL